MMTALLVLMMGWMGFIWLAWFLGRKAAQNPAATTELGVRLGKWLLK
jgi:hypothetical protein